MPPSGPRSANSRPPRGPRPPTPTPSARPPLGRPGASPKTTAASADGEHKVAGENACRALFEMRPGDIRRVYVTEAVLPRFKDVLGYCADQKLAYHVKTDADLDQIAETVHHDGVLFLARKQREASVSDIVGWAERLRPGQRSVIVLLENVKNPHNLGAILRVCAHFGVPWVLRAGSTPALSPAAMRTAEGGAEHSVVVGADDIEGLLRTLGRFGFQVLATSSHATMALGRDALPPRTIVMFGSEGDGLSPALQARADGVIAIPGSGALESLNVACAASVVLWELWRGATPQSTSASPSTPSTSWTPSWSSSTSPSSSPSPGRSQGPRGDRPPSRGRAQDVPPRPAGPQGRSGGRRGGPRG